MKRIVAMMVIGCFVSGSMLAVTGPITPASIEAAGKAVAVESVKAEEPERQPNAPTGMSSGAWTAILLAVIVVGGVLYLADKNDADHGGGGIFRANAQRSTATVKESYRHPLLRQQWQVR